MKVLWTVNTLNPEIAGFFGIKSSHSISWIEAMSEKMILKNEIQLAIACSGNVKKILTLEHNGIIFYLVPNNNQKKYWKNVLDDFKPDIIHAYGTEKEHNLIISDISEEIPIIVSLQGILNEYQRHYYAGIDMSTIIRYTPIRDIIRPSGFISGRKDFIKRAKKEIILLKKVKNVEGRSTWDRVSARKINPELNYYFCPRMLREPFYISQKWNIDNIIRHTIFISQGNYPIKGFHFALQALSQLKRKYPDVKLVITGDNFLHKVEGLKRLKATGYQRYIYDLIKKMNLANNIKFIGHQDAMGMAEEMRKCHITLLPSSIENAPNSLAEAMILGVPSVVSYVGGNMDMITHNKEGFLYCYNEPNMIVEYVTRIFESDELACKFSKNSISKAEDVHDQTKLVETLLDIYKKVIKNYNKY